MTETVQTEAFVLRAVNYGEADVIVTLLGRTTGVLAGIARSGRKSQRRFGGGLMPMRVIDATIALRPNRDLAQLKESAVVRAYPGLDASFEKHAAAAYATELMRSCVREGDRGEAPFDLLDTFFTRLADAEDDHAVLQSVLYTFELAVLDNLGAGPIFDSCHRCGLIAEQMDKLRCLRSGEGLVCADCSRPGERWGVLTTEAVQVLRYLAEPTGPAPRSITQEGVRMQVRRVLDASLAAVLDHELRSRDLLDTALFARGEA